ncbi:MAG: SAM-dependent methyltransferase [Alphaproteobacteria bacterium]
MSPLACRLKRLIAGLGPLTVEQYMAAALGDPELGYYNRNEPFGRQGDFVTAPEISQMFGELIGLWCAVTWRQMGAPKPPRLVEIGPGRGTLMADALRALQTVSDFKGVVKLHLIETSPSLERRQRERLEGTGATWHRTLAGLPSGPALIVANELFDALPIRQLVRTRRGWTERCVDTDGDGFRFVLAPGGSAAAALVPARLRDAPEGSVFEFSPSGISLAHQIGQLLAVSGGAALVIDYGHAESRLGETLQAVSRHRPHPVLEAPGEVDMTAHVDFALLGQAAREAGARTYGPVSQRAFLKALGIEARARTLGAAARPDEKAEIEAGLRRLTHDSEMGSLFKAFAITHAGAWAPAGFEQARREDPPARAARAPGNAGAA